MREREGERERLTESSTHGPRISPVVGPWGKRPVEEIVIECILSPISVYVIPRGPPGYPSQRQTSQPVVSLAGHVVNSQDGQHQNED